MKQSLQLRLGQQLTMTPQLQQAIRMLQLSTLELQTEIQLALDSNMMLEEAREGEELAGGGDEGEGDTLSRSSDNSGNSDEAGGDGGDGGDAEEYRAAESERELGGGDEPPSAIPDDLAVDVSWDDIYDPSTPAGSAPANEMTNLDYGDSTSEGLREQLYWQLDLTPMSDADRLVAEMIIDAINDDGLLEMSAEELREALLRDLPELELDEVEAVLHRVQQFDPPGIAARDLRECLLIQLRQRPSGETWHSEALALLEHHFEALAKRDFNTLKRRLKLDDDQLLGVITLIQSLNPRPGAQISSGAAEYIVPDVFVRRGSHGWLVELNPEAAPRLRVNAHYAGLIKQVRNPEESAHMKSHLQEARWFIKSLQSRNETLLKVARSIIAAQLDFLEQGDVAMRPMVLHDIAEELGMHESTISRVTNRKYMHTPRGIYELKYFFSSHVGTSDGGECSSTAIRALIKQLIMEENPAKPLSDNKIAGILTERGIQVARRTIAKYREALAIPPSNERKRLA